MPSSTLILPEPRMSASSAATLRAPAATAIPGVSPVPAITSFVAGSALGIAVIMAMAMGSGALTMVAGLGVVAVAVLSPSTGLVALAVLAPLKSPTSLPAPGLNTLLVGGILMGCLFRLPIERPRLRVSLSFVLLLGFMVYVFAQQTPDLLGGWQGDIGHLVGYQLFQLLTGFGAIIATALVVRGRPPWPYLAALLASSAVAGALAVITFGNLQPVTLIANVVQAWTDPTRAVGPFGNPNYLGQYMATAVVLALGVLLTRQHALLRVGALVALPVVAGGLAVSLSRGAVLAAFAGILMLAIARGRRATIAVLVIGVPLGLLAYALLLSGREGAGPMVLGGADAALTESTDGRVATVLEGPRLFLTNPIFGIGFGHFSFESETHLASHNWYSNVLAEQGLFGFLAWCGMLIVMAFETWRRNVDPRSVGLGLLGAVVVGSLFLELPTSFQTAVLPAMGITLVLVGDWSRSVPGRGRASVASATTPPHARPRRALPAGVA